MIRKTFTFTEDTVKKIDERDKTLYRKEYQFVEAAIQFYSEYQEKEKEEDLLKKIHADVKEIKQAVCKNAEGTEAELPLHLENLLE